MKIIAPPSSADGPPVAAGRDGGPRDRRRQDGGADGSPAAGPLRGAGEPHGSDRGDRMEPALLERLMKPLEARFGVSRVGLWLGDGRGLRLDGVDGVLTLNAPHRFAADRLEQSGLAEALGDAAAEAGLPAGRDPAAARGENRAVDAEGPGAGGEDGAEKPAARAHLRVVICSEAPAFTASGVASTRGGFTPAAPVGAARGVVSAAAGRAGGMPAPARPRSGPCNPGTARAGLPGGGPGHSLDGFVVGPCNDLAHAAAMGVANGDQAGPLFLHGRCGLGKTHLLAGLAAAWRESRAGAAGRVFHTTGERFTNRFIDHARRGELTAFRKEVRGAGLLAVDDVHFIAGKQKTQHELLHCFDAALAAGVPVVFASDRHPRELSAMGTALSSRCLQGLVAELHPPAAPMKRRLLVELGARRGLVLDAAAAAGLEPLCGPSVREIEGMLAKLDVLSRLTAGGTRSTGPCDAAENLRRLNTGNALPGGRPVGPGLVDRLRRLERPSPPPARLNPGPAGVATIANAVGEVLGVAPEDAIGNSRSRPVVQARAMVAHLARELTAMSYPEIARAMGRPSHSSVITADKRIRAQVAADARVAVVGVAEPASLRQLLDDLRARLAG